MNINELSNELIKLVEEYMACNKAIGLAKIDAGSFYAGGNETEKRDRKANEICTWLMINWGRLQVIENFPAFRATSGDGPNKEE